MLTDSQTVAWTDRRENQWAGRQTDTNRRVGRIADGSAGALGNGSWQNLSISQLTMSHMWK